MIQKRSAIYWTLQFLKKELEKRMQQHSDSVLEAVVAVPPRKEQLPNQPGQWVDMVTLVFPPTQTQVRTKLVICISFNFVVIGPNAV